MVLFLLFTCYCTAKLGMAFLYSCGALALCLNKMFGYITYMVTHTGFEPVYVSLRGLCVKPLHQCATCIHYIIMDTFFQLLTNE